MRRCRMRHSIMKYCTRIGVPAPSRVRKVADYSTRGESNDRFPLVELTGFTISYTKREGKTKQQNVTDRDKS